MNSTKDIVHINKTLMRLEMWLLILVAFLIQTAGCTDDEDRLLQSLLYTYNSRSHPTTKNDESVQVGLGMELYQVIEVKEKVESLQVSAWIHMNWKDERLAWNSTEYNGIKKMNLESWTIWKPDIVLFNSLKQHEGHLNLMVTDIVINSTGDAWWSSPMLFTIRCDIEVAHFPFDKQHCYLKFASWTHSVERMNLTGEEIDTHYYNSNQEWNLAGVETIRTEEKYPSGIFAEIDFHITLERRSMFFALNLIFPIFVITLLSMMAFILPSESGERMGVSLTLMLAVTVFMLLIAEIIPESSASIAMIEVYFVFCLVLIILMIIALCLISRLYNRSRIDPPMGDWTRKYILGRLAVIVGACRNNVKNKNSIDKALTSDRQEKEFHNNQDVNNDGLIYRNGEATSVMKNDSEMQEESRASNRGNNIKKDEDFFEYTKEEEWRIVGRTMDHCLFAFFFAAFIIGTICCFVKAKYIH